MGVCSLFLCKETVGNPEENVECGGPAKRAGSRIITESQGQHEDSMSTFLTRSQGLTAVMHLSHNLSFNAVSSPQNSSLDEPMPLCLNMVDCRPHVAFLVKILKCYFILLPLPIVVYLALRCLEVNVYQQQLLLDFKGSLP